MTRRLQLIAWPLVLMAAIAAFALFGLASHPASGRAAPALPREHLAGAPVTLTSLLKGAGGRPALVVFWASWCGPCAREAPTLERFSESPAGRGRIAGVDWSDARSGARAFIRRYAWTFPNVRDAEGTVGSAYRLTGLPTTFVINANGRIRRVLRGPQNEHSLQAALAAMERS
jgi:thiol-disulfide isomerase/thioredoxin